MYVIDPFPEKSFIITSLQALALRTVSFLHPDRDAVDANELLPVAVVVTSCFLLVLIPPT